MSDLFTSISLADASASVSSLNATFVRKHFDPGHAVQDEGAQARDAYSEGYVAGQGAAETCFAAEREALRHLVASTQAFAPGHSEELAVMIATVVEQLVMRIVGSAPIDRTHLQARIADALELVDEAATAQTLWLHPDDLALVDDMMLGVELHADHTLERGALRLDCSSGWIEDNRSSHLAALRQTLGLGTPL